MRHQTRIILARVIAVLWGIVSASVAFGQQAGTLDLTFNPGTGPDGPVLCMALQTNGQVVIGGGFRNFNGQPSPYVARLNPDGSFDPTFNVGQGPGGSVQCLAVQSNGSVIIGGSFGAVDNISAHYGLARLRPDGSLDTTFLFQNPLITYDPTLMVLQSDGRILVVGGNGGTPSGIARFNTDGSLDSTFNASSGERSINALVLQPNGQILLGGQFITGTNVSYLARLNADGTMDQSFNPTPFMGGSVNCLALMPNGQFMVGGYFSTINGYTRDGLARFNANGSWDMTFSTPVSEGNYVSLIVLEPDGKLLVSKSGVLTRLNTNGTIDVTFKSPDFQGIINAMALQSDGKLLVAGGSAGSAGFIVRLNGDTSTPVQPQLLSPSLYMGMLVSGVAGTTNRIEATFNLTNAVWTPLFDVVLQTNLQFIVDPTPAGFPSRFYRAIQVP